MTRAIEVTRERLAILEIGISEGKSMVEAKLLRYAREQDRPSAAELDPANTPVEEP